MKMGFKTSSFVFLMLLGFVYCQNSIDVEDGLKKISEEIPELSELDVSKLPSGDELEKALKEKCEKRGAPDAVEFLKAEQERARVCIEQYVNATQVEAELEEAKKTGSMDEVFAKYCNKWPKILGCFDNATMYMRQCMETQEDEAFNKTMDIIKELKEFMCFKDGDRLAMFVAEGGVECIKEQEEGVKRCFNETIGAKIPDSDDFSASTLPAFLFTASDCSDFDKLRSCINKELEKCEDSTPANIVDAFFKFLKKQMPCAKASSVVAEKPENPNSAWKTLGNTLLVASMLFLIL